MKQTVNPFRLFRTGLPKRVPVGQGVQQLLDVAVVFKVLDGQVAGGVPVTDLLVFEDQVAQPDDAPFDFRTVIDMEMSGDGRVRVLIDPDDRIEQLRDAPAVAAHRRAHGHAQQAAQLGRIQPVPLVLQLVIHVEGHHGPEVHVDDLGRQVQVPFDVRGVHDIDHHVRHRIDQVLAHIQLLRGIG